jgi:putative transposase
MPWLETSPMDQRVDFVREFESGCFTMTELAAQYGISRRTGYKWLARHDREGVLGLQDRSRRPHHSPQATEAALVAVRTRHPHWGAKKLLTIAARRAPTAAWPSVHRVDTFEGAGIDRPPSPPPPTDPADHERPAGDPGGK